MSEGIVKFKQDFIETIPIKTAATTYDFLDHAPKKDKKWSLGNLFRRKKKEESESSSDEEVKRKNLVNKKKRRNDKRKKNLGFDHIVVAKSRGSYIVTNGVEDAGILSDPSGGFSSYVGRPLPRIPVEENKNDYGVDSITRKGKRERTKARAIARRDSLRQGSSSDEDSQRSYSSARFRSDESLSRARDGSMSRRSRTARTERYIKRLSKDDESILNREALQRQTRENWHLKLPEDLSRYGRSASKSPILSSTPKSAECYINSAPLSQPTYSGLFTIPPSHSNHNKFRTSNPQLSNPTPKQDARSFNNRSISCEANIHNQQETIIHAQLPIAKPNRFRNLSLIEQPRLIKQPPPPPPRDPRRLVQIDSRPMSFCSQRRNNENLFQPSYRTVSEDHIPTEPRQSLSPRPSSVTNENRRHTPESTDKFQYLTEKKARSRKPIFIQSQESIKSPQMFTAETHVQTKVYLPSAVATENRNQSPFKPISNANSNDSIAQEINRKSSNLEEALDELEAIYKSLHLGDEDLLERAEQREMSIASKKLIEAKAESYPAWGVIPRGAISDSSFTYEPFDSVDSPKKKRFIKKSHTLDRKNDDMAYRKLHKERANTINNSQSVISNVSYLLASPVHGMQDETESIPDENNHEPDVTLDDVVYRTIKHANNSLKVIDPQPPFGIPIGPITPAPNSDYLHAAPELIPRYSFKLKKIPDVVKDDLAFRNLRKDSNKEPALENNNSTLKKKRAVRSLSANLMNIKENNNVENEFKKTTLTDIADAMEIARQILKEKDSRINSTRRAFLSDSETKNMKYTSDNGVDNITESRMNFLNDMRNDKVKDSSFEDLLTALAVEARETSDRITKELDELDIKKQHSNELQTNGKQELNKRLEEIDEVSEHARLCEKLLECVVKTEEVEDIEIHSVSDHDYENLGSDAEFDKAIPLIDEDVAGSRSPFEEHREELIASFKGLGKLDNRDFSSEDEEGIRCIEGAEGGVGGALGSPDSRRIRRSCSFLEFSLYEEGMSEQRTESRAERMARYKEERRRQLAVQFTESANRLQKDSSSGSDGPRTTKASRLRAAANASNDANSSLSKIDNAKESPKSPVSSITSPGDSPRPKYEKDKSSKRKSNLNRSLNCEEVPVDANDDNKNRRRRRRFFPPEVLVNSNEQTSRSDASLTANLSPLSSPITASATTLRTNPRKSELSIHMENARKGVTSSPSSTFHQDFAAKTNVTARTRRVVTSSPLKQRPSSDKEVNGNMKQSNKENIKRKTDETSKKQVPQNNNDSSSITRSTRISKRMEELSNLTKETLARVERLSNRNKESPKRDLPVKKKDQEVTPSPPVSILKRKVSQEESKTLVTPPVTFSPNVIEPATTNRKQGILKKRRSLDESQVLRHRSCSPDVAGKSDSRSILKTKRRSSLEEITRVSTDGIQGILKRRTSRNEDDFDNSLNSPQSILKRRSGASSAGSSSSTHHHVSIATAVILAAAEGAEIILDSVKPILKKKSFSEDCPNGDANSDLKPILKKKSSTDTDDSEEKPKRPILKLKDTNSNQNLNDSCFECEVKPILKPRLSFGEPSNGEMGERRTNDRRRSQTLSDLDFTMNGVVLRDRDRDLGRPRVISVSELVMSFEKSTGAIPKRSSLKRQSDNRYRTQPITFNEFEASLNYVQSPQREEFPRLTLTSPQGNNHSVQSLLDLTSSLENDNRLSSYLSNSVPNTSSDSGVGKMSSDSAFQSLGDGLELEQEDTSPKKVIPKLEMQMKAIAEEAKKMKLLKVNAGIQKYKNRSTVSSTSRYSTQPVTLDEVQEAAKIKREDQEKEDASDEDPCNLSLSERIKLFTKKQQEELDSAKLESPKRRTRFITQPVTYDEVKSAISLNCDYYTRSPSPYALDSESDRKGILKASPRHRSKSPRPLSYKMLSPDPKPKSILKSESAAAVPDFTYDEGISSNDSDDTDTESRPGDFKINLLKKYSSSDESSGGKEIQSIIGREAMMKRRQLRSTNSNGCVIQKSKSQAGVAAEQQRQLAVEAAAAVAAGGIRKSKTTDAMRRIEKIQEQLKQSGDNDWKRRIPNLNNSNQEINLLNSKNLYNDELSDYSNLKAKKDELDASSKQWKSRVEKSDATNYSVTGRMQQNKDVPNISINIPIADKVRRMPKAKRFKGKDGDETKETISTPVSPEIDNGGGTFRRSISVPNNAENDSSGSDSSLRSSGRKVKVTRPDDDTFQSFFQSVKGIKTVERVEVSLDDFDSVSRQTETLLVQKKNIRVQRRVKGASKNPLKALAARSDIQSEYTEVATGIAERESKRLNVEKLARNSNLAMEALAGLASKEDFAAVSLKKGSSNHISYLPFNSMMLLQIKGRRHVQTRLVEPVATSINQGDNYILITPDALFNYIGSYSNVIEQSRAADIVNHIQSTRDMGCKVEKAIVLGEKSYGSSKDSDKFWKLLNADEKKIVEAGHPDEDEVYETRMIDTNMIYYVENDELVPLEEYWGKIPKIEMLQPSRVLVFDFGSEMYVWSGKTANPDVKKTALNLAKQLWDSGYNYSDCELCPLNIANVLGARAKIDQSLKADARPDWAIFAKISQHRETILFREKFLDWPDYSRVIRVKDNGNEKNNSEATIDIKPCNAKELICEYVEPNFETEGSLLGRGRNYFNEESNIHSEIKTLSVTTMRILENTFEELPEESKGHFYDGDSYIIRWKFRVTVTGRELSGKPSKHAQVGRDRCIYFYWLGMNSSMNEQGVAALLTIELDKVENAKQYRVLQGLEPPVFLQLFDGKMFVHSGKRDQDINDERLYICRGEVESESSLVEVPCSMRSLRSRTTFVYVNKSTVVVWQGCKASDQTKQVTKTMQEFILSEKPDEFGLEDEVELKVYKEGQEDESFLECLGEKRHLYESLLESNEKYAETMKLFRFNSIHGKFEVTQTLCPHRSKDFVTPYPFLQSELYSANQPALYLLDNGHELWLWQGWWPERDTDLELSEQTGSGAIRWQAERKAAMQTAIDYWALRHPNFEAKTAPAFLVWAGLEPLSFTNLFPIWCDRDDIAGLNIKEGKKAGDKVLIEKELTLLTRTTYPLSELLQRPLPDGVNPTHLENYLSLEDFDKLLSMSKEEFQKLPIWKQNSLKKEKGLF